MKQIEIVAQVYIWVNILILKSHNEINYFYLI